MDGPTPLLCRALVAALLALLLLPAGCAEDSLPSPRWKTVMVNATAYTSRRHETDDTPYLAAWNNRLKPGMKAIAVSRDLLRMGLRPDSYVRIEGLPGRYRVLDKMNRRWKRRIDIYFGNDLQAAQDFGRKELLLSWRIEPDDKG